jgi:hypothetical protein
MICMGSAAQGLSGHGGTDSPGPLLVTTGGLALAVAC